MNVFVMLLLLGKSSAAKGVDIWILVVRPENNLVQFDAPNIRRRHEVDWIYPGTYGKHQSHAAGALDLVPLVARVPLLLRLYTSNWLVVEKQRDSVRWSVIGVLNVGERQPHLLSLNCWVYAERKSDLLNSIGVFPSHCFVSRRVGAPLPRSVSNTLEL